MLPAEVILPTVFVDVLSAKRTFWEQATLAHDMCNREEWTGGAGRNSRHWSDLAQLADHPIGVEALNDRELLADVVRVKLVFYKRSTSRYEECLSRGLRLIPDAEGLAALEEDYRAMIEAAMFSEPPSTFEALIARIHKLEREINK